MSAGFFEGEERLAVFDGLGYLTRKGNPQSLAVSDRERLERAIAVGDGALAQAYFDALLPRHLDMLEMLLERALQFPASAEVLTSAMEERLLTRLAVERFAVESSSIATDATTAALLDRASDRLAQVTPEDAPELRRHKAAGERSPAMSLLEAVEEHAGALQRSLSEGDWRQAKTGLRDYVSCYLTLHDALVNFISAYASAAVAKHGSQLGLELVRHSFSSLSFYERLWSLPKILDSEALAAFLAEHLRSHLSGPNRGGSVKIEEDADCYRLIFDPCGSGGALRRRLAGRREGAVVKDACPMTWGRADEVPPFCAHCANNELVSIERFGYPVLVTEFDPDPHQPCGWTVYKTPEAVPEDCYRRLGIEPPSAREGE